MVEATYGRYELVEKVGQGGMAVVYRAFDPVLSRTVALKLLHPHLAERHDSRVRFSREAKAVARLKHTNIVEVFDYASPESERSYIVTEFIDGPTLKDFIEQEPLFIPEIAALLLLPVCEALAKAHHGGIIHRDVKPENIMLRSDGSPVLMDFGIAQMIDMPTLTATGTMLGSPAHMAPEVIDGKDIGAASDIFSVGTTLYLLVTGSLPFTAPNPSALFRRILETRYDPVLQRRPAAGRTFARLIERCLKQTPEERPTASELVQLLRAILNEAGILDVQGELRTFYADPQAYQDELKRRLIPFLLDQALMAVEEDRTAAALDALDRVLAYDKSNTDALAVLARIERSQRLSENMRQIGLLACGLLPIIFGVWFYLSTTDDPEPPALVIPVTQPETLGGALPPPDSGTPPADARLETVTDAQATRDASTAPDARLQPDPARPQRRRRRTRSAQRPRPQKTKPAQDAAVTPAVPAPSKETGLVPFGSRYKGAVVFVDGKRVGNIAPLAMKPLSLTVGRHNVRITNEPSCKPEAFTLDVRKGTNPRVAFDCRQKRQARVLIRTNPPGQRLDVNLRNGARKLGTTNKEFRVPMNALQKRETLTIGSGSQYREIEVLLKAGQLAEPTVNL